MLYYNGTDHATLSTFANERTCLLHVNQGNPRRQLQQQYINQILRVEEVPDTARVLKEYPASELLWEEVALLARIGAVLSEDYLLADVDIRFADISHGVTILVTGGGASVHVILARNSGLVRPVLETYKTAREVFTGFVKDFVRNHLYQRLINFIPSSTREGADALARTLQRNRELYRLEERDLGGLEALLGDLIAGEKTLAEVLETAQERRPCAGTEREPGTSR